MSNMFKGMNDPKIPVGGDRLYFGPGSYRVRIDAIKAIDADTAFDGVASFIVECIVVLSTNPTIKPGAVVGWVQKFHKDPKKGGVARAFASVKGFYAAVLKANDLDAAMALMHMDLETFAAHCTSEANPLRGFIVDLVCTEKRSKDKQTGAEKVFTTHQWCIEGSINFAA